MFFDPLYLIIVGPTILIALWAQFKVKSTFNRYLKQPLMRGIDGSQAAEAILRAEGITDVSVEQTKGFLSDHYDPKNKKLRLSPDVYHGRSIAAVGVAAHEVGHAIQHARGYAPLAIRSAIVPFATFGSWLAWPMIMLGFILKYYNLALLGVTAFGALVVFQLVTLPVEFDASKRAITILDRLGIVNTAAGERSGVVKVLGAAALTYVAATITALAQLFYFLLQLGIIGGGDD